MEDLKELEDFLSPTLIVPVRAKDYRVEAPDAHTGLKLQKLLQTGMRAETGQELTAKDIELVSDEEEEGFFESVLGSTYQELLTDGVSYPGLKLVASTAFIWTTQGFDMAQEFWRAGGKAPAPNRAARRTATKTRTAVATTTQKPVSANTTKSRQKPKATPGSKS
jgi:hypothetical protein